MKFLTLMIMVIGIVFLFNMAGFTTASGDFVSGFLESGFSYFTSSEFWSLSCSNFSDCTSNIPLLLAIGVAAGAVAGLFGRSPDISYTLGGVTLSLMSMVVIEMGSLWTLISPLVDGWMKNFLGTIFILLSLGLIVTGISWFRGAD